MTVVVDGQEFESAHLAEHRNLASLSRIAVLAEAGKAETVASTETETT